jgi:hypothetical protein
MDKQEINYLQHIVMGQSFSESIIDKAIKLADTKEVKVCLNYFKTGESIEFDSRMI